MESTALAPLPRLFSPNVGSIRFTTSTSHCSFIDPRKVSACYGLEIIPEKEKPSVNATIYVLKAMTQLTSQLILLKTQGGEHG